MGHLDIVLFFSILVFSNSNSLTMASKLTGTVTFLGNKSIHPNSTAIIKIIETSKADAPSKTICILNILINFNYRK